MTIIQQKIIQAFQQEENISKLSEELQKYHNLKVHLNGLKGSSRAFIIAALHQSLKSDKIIIMPDEESALYLQNDLEALIEQTVYFYPSAYKKSDPHFRQNHLVLERVNILSILKKKSTTGRVILTYPEALTEKIISEAVMVANTAELKLDHQLDLDFLIAFLIEAGFEMQDYVYEAGSFAVRGGIIDIYSFSNALPYRIELKNDTIESIREFDPESQLSTRKMNELSIIPNPDMIVSKENIIPFLNLFSPQTVIFVDNITFVRDAYNRHCELVEQLFINKKDLNIPDPSKYLVAPDDFLSLFDRFSCVLSGGKDIFSFDSEYLFDQSPQPNFNKNFRLLSQSLAENTSKSYHNFIFSDSSRQIERIYEIFEDMNVKVDFVPVYKSLQSGFIDHRLKAAFFSEHEIFNRYLKYRQSKHYTKASSISLKELYELKPGDYVTHINHGIGRFSGLQKIKVNEKVQEAIRLEFKDGDLLYLSIHSIYKISRYVGKEGKEPKLHRLGSNVWENMKTRAKNRVKDIARDLIHLYARRKAVKGHRYSPDSYLQTALEASFIYEDTPDQSVATNTVKADMEKEYPMDRLICGDVGYGKTEIAIRAAFKAVADSKQVAVLVPTTILALQHYKTFTDRLNDFPCKLDYLSRFKSAKQSREIKDKLKTGAIDIIIGTHKLLGKDIAFRDLGLLVIDEEQKFGVAAKEKLRAIKLNVDTLSLTATPIPRTLQFSLMGVRDLSIINTPPPNRQAIDTFIKPFDKEIIREAIEKEIERDGQVFLVHNRIKDLNKIAGIVNELVPHAKIAVAHGQMEGASIEEIMLNYIEGYYDVLVSTNIIESGLDIPNANTIIINDAQNFGLSDLYQMRGRVGRSNIKAYCYLLVPSLTALSSDARKRLAAIEEFSDLGSGLHIAMRDLDIRGAGNLLGAEQSGFISEIGIDMYKKILDEALMELKVEEFSDFFKDRQDIDFYKDCIIDTDLEVLIPDEYVSNIEERLLLYNRLNKINNETELKDFEKELTDRFGKLPFQVNDLFYLIRMKWIANKMDIERIVLKKNIFKAFFPYTQAANEDFQKQIFSKILAYVHQHPNKCRFNEKENGLELQIYPVPFIDQALQSLERIYNQG